MFQSEEERERQTEKDLGEYIAYNRKRSKRAIIGIILWAFFILAMLVIGHYLTKK